MNKSLDEWLEKAIAFAEGLPVWAPLTLLLLAFVLATEWVIDAPTAGVLLKAAGVVATTALVFFRYGSGSTPTSNRRRTRSTTPTNRR